MFDAKTEPTHRLEHAESFYSGSRKVLSTGVAQQIVKQLSQVIEHHINIMDIQGVIIASTDPNRIGSLHGGAKKIIDENLKELLIETDDEYVGSRNGINLPIEFDLQIVGVIGLTGKTDVVYKYSQIIKKMTEVLLLDSFMREQRIIEQKARDRFFEEWIFGQYHVNHPVEFSQRAKTLKIDVETPKRVMVFSIKKNNHSLNDQLQTTISHHIRNYFSTLPQAYLFRTTTLYIAVLNQVSDESILTIAEAIKKMVFESFECDVYIGIDYQGDKPIKVSFDNANEALQMSFKSQKHIHIYDIINIDLFINTIDTKHKQTFIRQLFNQANDEDVERAIRILKAFYAFEGSLQKASEALFIHKNTLQYRLNKISEMTGYDPRKISISYMFMMAIKMYDSLRSQNNY